MSGSVAAVIIVLGLAAIAAIVYLFRIGALGKAKGAIKVPVGAFPLTFEIELQSKERQISEKHFNMVDTNRFYVDSGVGFVIHKPSSEEWTVLRPTFREALKEKGYADEAIDLWETQDLVEQPSENLYILSIRRGSAASIRPIAETTVDGHLLDLNVVQKLFPGGEELAFDEITIGAYAKKALKSRVLLLDFFLGAVELFRGLGPKKLSINPDNTVFLLDCSAIYQEVEYNGVLGDCIINNMMLVQENREYFFEVIVSYVQAGDKPTKVWDELRDYLRSFRVLVK